MSLPAARISDYHVCPLVNPGPVPHLGGPVAVGCPTVLINGLPAARIGDVSICAGPPDPIVAGSTSVLIGSVFASRLSDMTSHGGSIVVGSINVLIGNWAGGGGGVTSANAAGSGSGSSSGGPGSAARSKKPKGSTGPIAGLGAQANTLLSAAENNTPFCEVCSADAGAKSDA